MRKRLEAIVKISMPYNRSKWVDELRDAHLGGALGEYAKLVIARNLKEKDFWSNEVKRILKKVEDFMNPKIIKTETKFKREKALNEAINEAARFQKQIVAAKKDYIKEVLRYKPKTKVEKVRSMDLDSVDLMVDMLEEFLPLKVKKIIK